MKKLTAAGKKLIFFLPLVCGMIGLVGQTGEDFLDALYQCVGMYLMNYGDTPPNLWVEIARWTAPLITASGAILAIGALRRMLGSWLRYLRQDSVAVYGTGPAKSVLLKQLGCRGVDGGQDLVPAHRYILADSEDKNFAFYQEHRQELAERQVYLQCRSLSAQSNTDPMLRFFCLEENAARLFWRQRGMYKLSCQQGHRLRIVFLGFEKLGEELLLRGLQSNLFSPDQSIEYHIFGATERFGAVHRGTAQIGDPIIFYQEPWYTQLPLLEEADLLLVLEQEGQAKLLEDLLLATTRQEIDVFAGSTLMNSPLAKQQRLRLFAWEQAALNLKIVMDDLLLARAKAINLRYGHLYSGLAETAENRESEWAKLDAFTRESNISAADYHMVRLDMLTAMGLPAAAEQLPPEVLELLAELEHIRWCRYHYLSNWTFGQPENGKRKDPVRRIHADLIPYQELTHAEREKDRENVRILLSVKEEDR